MASLDSCSFTSFNLRGGFNARSPFFRLSSISLVPISHTLAEIADRDIALKRQQRGKTMFARVRYPRPLQSENSTMAMMMESADTMKVRKQ